MTWGTFTLVGSGEFSSLMAKTYRNILERIPGAVRGVFLDTPAGFELNSDAIAAKALDYFRQRLSLDVEVASLRSSATPPDALAACLAALARANFTFAGPGSPTYATRVWQATQVPQVFAQRLQDGAHLIFASAAAIAVGRYALPVYEIYKVGQDAYWAEGLDLLGPYGLELAIVPHWNNTEGGTHDTAFCYMGAARLAQLEAQLPDSAVVLGLDEYTACTLDLVDHTAAVTGAGGVTLRYGGREQHFSTGARFPLEQLTAGGARLALPERAVTASAHAPDEPPPEAPEAAALSVDGHSLTALLDLLVRLRDQLRAEKQWKLADEIRDELVTLGVEIGDSPAGTRWKWKDEG